MKTTSLRALGVLGLTLLMLTGAAMASGSHECVDADKDHFCDLCWESVSLNCVDADGDHWCDVCGRQVRTHCTDGDADGWCDVCGGHMPDSCTDEDQNHVCDTCWAVLSTCMDEDKDHLCDVCGGVFWVDNDADGVCDGCDAVLTHVVANYRQIYYHTKGGALVADVVIDVAVEPSLSDVGLPAGTVHLSWTDPAGGKYTAAAAELAHGARQVTVEHPSLSAEALNYGRVVFVPYDAGFTPAENGCVAEYDLPLLRVDSDSGYTVNGVEARRLYLAPGTRVEVVLQPGPTQGFQWVFEEGSARPELSVDGLNTVFTMPREDVDLYAAWRCEECTDTDADGWCDVCAYAIEKHPAGDCADVAADSWYYTAVDYVLAQELMATAAEGSFAPAAAATRGELMYALWMMEGAPTVNYILPFTDVDPEDPRAEAVRWAAAMGIAKGYPDQSFCPDQALSRQEMATFLYRYEQLQGGGFTGMWMFLLNCTDRAEVADWAYEAMCWLSMKGMFNGDGTGAFNPTDGATRAEMAQLLWNYRMGQS